MPLSQNAKNRLDAMLSRHAELEADLGRQEIIANREKLSSLSKEFSPLAEIASAYREYDEKLKELENCTASLEKEHDSEMAELYKLEIPDLEIEALEKETRLMDLLFPKAEEKHPNIILEIRAGPGGLEAALFAGDLHRMYTRYVEIRGWKTEMISASPSPMGGFKEIIFAVKGREAFSRLQFESGVHRVQRIPVTEAGGRIHTSTATVAVLPEPEEIDEVPIDPSELRIDTFRASGKGGQHVNKTDSAIRITHLPTSISVECQDERSQHQNKAKAMRFLRARLLKIAQETQMEEIARDRKSQVGTGDRSEKIRTFNFPQNRVTDHRAGVSVYKLAVIIDGYMDEILELVAAFFRENSEKTAAPAAAD